jgi:hypothetical protein
MSWLCLTWEAVAGVNILGEASMRYTTISLLASLSCIQIKQTVASAHGIKSHQSKPKWKGEKEGEREQGADMEVVVILVAVVAEYALGIKVHGAGRS